MKSAFVALCALASFASAAAKGLYFDGRIPLGYTAAQLDASDDPYLTVVKGSTKNASYYTTLLGHTLAPSPLWQTPEQVLRVTIDNSSVFVPGGNPQYGFRRTELLAQKNGSHAALEAAMEVGKSVFHFSVREDETARVDWRHEYQVVFVEPSDGTHVFGITLGSPFSNPPASSLPTSNAREIRVLDHSYVQVFAAPFAPRAWHNFGVQVDWDNRTLAVFYSVDGRPLKKVTGLLQNPTAAPLPAGRGEFHIGLLKMPIVNMSDPVDVRGDVAHHGIQDRKGREGLLYSGVFVEDASGGVRVGYGARVPAA